MITADEARKISDSNAKDGHCSFLFKYAIDQIERYVRATAGRGGRSFSFNVDTLSPGYSKTDLQLRKAVAEESSGRTASHIVRPGEALTAYGLKLAGELAA